MIQMEKLGCRACAWPVVAVVAIIAFAAIAIFSDWPWGTESPWVALTAIGTISATVMAVVGVKTSLKIAQHERTIRISERDAKGAVIATSLVVSLARRQVRIDMLMAYIDEKVAEGKTSKWSSRGHALIADNLERLAINASVETLASISHLPELCAAKIARADEISKVSAAVWEESAAYFHADNYAADKRAETIKDLRVLLSDYRKCLMSALHVCASSSGVWNPGLIAGHHAVKASTASHG
ncbi:hypothetical protein H0A66_02885 [Alcaligenaceae bacterium]|nr:hypothetical protein [Alcaligenaceae bacterium]